MGGRAREIGLLCEQANVESEVGRYLRETSIRRALIHFWCSLSRETLADVFTD